MPDRHRPGRLQREDTARKTHFTAAVLIPPEESWPAIQRIRRLHDPNVRRWMPHITLLYPFVSHERLPQAAILCAEAVARLPAPEVMLAQLAYFNHPSGRVTLWVSPSPPDRIIAVQEALQMAFPGCDETSRHETGYVPHLSLGSFQNRTTARVTRDQLEDTWRPLKVSLPHVALIARSGYEKDPFRVVAQVPIGARLA
jgi:RNA 2',3'-cyclic 3'-phosphodiesterase